MKQIRAGGLALSLLLLSGCWKRAKRPVVRPTESAPAADQARTRFFDEQEQAFVLEEKDNVFAPDESVQLVNAGSMWVEKEGRFETIYFDFDRYVIRPDQKPALDRVATELKSVIAEKPNVTVVIEGHACNSAGSPTYNMALSERRAQAAFNHLVKGGLPAHRLVTVGRGSEMRKVASGDRDQQAPNRRVEFHLVEKKGNQ